MSRTLTIQTLDRNGDPVDFDGELALRVRPGRLSAQQQPKVTLVDGQATTEVFFQAAFGRTRIWVTDEGDKFADSERIPSYATGLSEELHFMLPTIREFNEIEDTETNHLVGEFTEIRAEDREIVATVVGANGFWVTDLVDAPGNYASMYIYTFQKPEHVVAGTRLEKVNGGNQEYLGSTQLSFPSYIPDTTQQFEVPEAVELSESQICDSAMMEAHESALVKISNAVVPDTFTSGSADYAGYLEYGQWPLKVGACTVYVDSSALSYAFDPLEYAGQNIPYVQGMVSQIWSKWVILIVDDSGTPFSSSDFPERPNPPGPKMPRIRRR